MQTKYLKILLAAASFLPIAFSFVSVAPSTPLFFEGLV